jgi:tetratricopeptide (TPR) repeat protein
MRCRLVGQIALALCVLQGATVSALPTDPLPEAVRTLEADGKLAEARQQLNTLKPPLGAEDLKARLELIDKTTNLLGVIDAYVKHGLTKQAIDALTAFLPSVSQARDAGLAIVVQRRLTELQQRSSAEVKRQEAIEQAARGALTRADAYFNRGLYQKAKDAYDAVAKQTDPISEDTKLQAKLGVEKATQHLFDDEPYGIIPTLFRSFSDAARTIWQWVLTFLVVLAIIFVLRRIWLTRKRSLELVDLSLAVASPAANRELAQELQDVIDRIVGAGPGSAKLDATGAGDLLNEDGGELPPPDLVFVTPTVDAPALAKELDAFVSSTPAISVGGIGLNPQQLWTFIKSVMTPRPRHAFTGTLSAYDNTLTLRLMHEDRRFGTKSEWRASAPSASAEARITCLVDIASRIILDGEKTPTVTGNCDSLKEYILGLYALAANTADAFKNARAHFQNALDRDNGNWLARFQLALCARGTKDTRTAIRHLTWFTGPEAAASTSLQCHITANPDFPHVVEYQRASTLSLASDDREDPEVGRILGELVALETNAEGKKLNASKRLRLVMLARSGQCNREAVKASLVRDDSPDKERTRLAREGLRAQVNWFNQHAEELQRAAPSGHPLARGIVLHAYGRMQFSSGDRNGAIQSLSEAVDLMPTYADVHVDLAKAHLERKDKTSWPQRVTTLLDRALALDPANAKAKFVYARFYFAEETRDYAKAEPYLTAAPFDPASLFMLAQVLNNRGSYAESLGVLERAIALQEKGPTFRVRLYADSLQELVRIATDTNNVTDPKPNRRAIERARGQLCKYDKLFDDDDHKTRNYQRVAEIYTEICKLLKVAPGACFQLPPAPVAAPPVPAAPPPAPLPGAATAFGNAEPAAT